MFAEHLLAARQLDSLGKPSRRPRAGRKEDVKDGCEGLTLVFVRD